MAGRKTTTTKAPAAPKAKTFKESDIDDTAFTSLYEGGSTGAYVAAGALECLVFFAFATADLTKNDTEGNVAGWITEKGNAYFIENYDVEGLAAPEGGPAETVAGKVATTAASGDFVIRTDVPMPTGRRGYTERGNKYPFAALPLNGSFHIPATDEKPKPSATFASTVTSANKRYETEGKRFVIRAVGPDDPDGKGARIYREK